ncbi:MAG: penicillin-binding transpeptidase domain-containing protein [Balneolaceae bacterium]
MKERTSIMARMFILMGLILLVPFAILVQIFRVNVVEGDGLRELWSSQAIDYISIPAQRGEIYDVNGSLLATNSVVYKIAVDPHFPGITRDNLQTIGTVLSQHTQRSPSHYANKITNAPSHSRYIVLERSISVQAYEDIRELGIRGVILEEDYQRSYNFESLSAHVLGYVNHNIEGMTGLEAQYNNKLKGNAGEQQVRRDRANRIFSYVGAPRKTPQQGLSLHTTLNSYIQAITEEELEEGVKRNNAKQGTAIVMDPRTGAIKAMANYPTYNPNQPASIDSENRRNFAVSDMMEPGSTFKLVTAIAALEQGVVDFDEIFETPESGMLQIHGQWMRDHDPLGDLDFREVIAKSSNIGTSEIAMRIDPNSYYQYARNMGFGTETNIDLPNETGGKLQRPYEWSGVTLPWMSIGYEVQTTALQVLQAYGAFANGGLMMKPYLVSHLTDQFGNKVEEYNPRSVRQIARKETIEKLLPVFKSVVTDSGTAGWAAVDGLEIAGKTGTAQKLVNGRYSTSYRASFAGFFPADDPKYVMLILLDEPKTSFYGGYTAGAVFKEIATRIAGLDSEVKRSVPLDRIAEMEHKVVPKLTGLTASNADQLLSMQNTSYKTTGSGTHIVNQTPESGEEIINNTSITLVLGDLNISEARDGYVEIPDLRDMNMRQAASLLRNKGLNIDMEGSGTIYNQFPLAGEVMREGRTVTVRGRARSMQQISQISHKVNR